MKILLLFFGFLKSKSIDNPFEHSENYRPIRHEEIKEKLSDNKLRAYLAKANVLLGYDKPVKTLFEIEDLTPPWEDEEAWDALVPKERNRFNFRVFLTRSIISLASNRYHLFFQCNEFIVKIINPNDDHH